MSDEWEQVKDEPKENADPNLFWNPAKKSDQPRSIEGEVLEKIAGRYGTQVALDTKDGKRNTSGQKGLSPKLEKVNVGNYIKVTWTGQKNTGKANDMYTYDVFVKKNYTPKPKDQPVNDGQDAIIGSIMADLKFAQNIFNGTIPEQNTLQRIKKFCMGTNAGKETEILATLKTKGLVVQNAQGYQVV